MRSESYIVAEDIAKTVIWLPSSLKLSNDDINMICEEIKKFFNQSSTLR
jgi:dTDP-4-amino-4,6-dideoxygalactose transaminase